VLTLVDGYDIRYKDSEPIGSQINMLTSGMRSDALSRTTFHKYVHLHVYKIEVVAAEVSE